jgi:PilZ domain
MKAAWQDDYWVRRRRSSDRYDLASGATLRREGHADLPVDLLNISRNGCRVETPQMLPIGDTVILDIPGTGAVEGRVVWHLGFKAGVEFNDHIAWKNIFGALLKAVPPGSQDRSDQAA